MAHNTVEAENAAYFSEQIASNTIGNAPKSNLAVAGCLPCEDKGAACILEILSKTLI